MKNKQPQKFSNVLQEAYKLHYKQVEVPKRFLFGMYLAQLFEYSLDQLLITWVKGVGLILHKHDVYYNPSSSRTWTYKDYANRLHTFISPKSNGNFYKFIKDADEKRNNFIHESFRGIEDDVSIIDGDLEKFYLSKKSNKVLDDWIKSFVVAYKEINRLKADAYKKLDERIKFKDVKSEF